jgi:hypothetical protein
MAYRHSLGPKRTQRYSEFISYENRTDVTNTFREDSGTRNQNDIQVHQ